MKENETDGIFMHMMGKKWIKIYKVRDYL